MVKRRGEQQALGWGGDFALQRIWMRKGIWKIFCPVCSWTVGVRLGDFFPP